MTKSESGSTPQFFTPIRILALFTVVNTITYFDRGAFASCLDKIEHILDLSNTTGGILGGAYMIGYCIASLVFAHFSPNFRPLRLMCLGLFMWCLACFGSGLANDFYTVVIARTCTGVGEASFTCLAPPFIDIVAPPSKRSQWVSIFYVAIPLGYALGYMIGGKWLAAAVFGEHWSWRFLFIAESALMVPLILVCLAVPGPRNLQDLADQYRSSEPLPTESETPPTQEPLLSFADSEEVAFSANKITSPRIAPEREGDATIRKGSTDSELDSPMLGARVYNSSTESPALGPAQCLSTCAPPPQALPVAVEIHSQPEPTPSQPQAQHTAHSAGWEQLKEELTTLLTNRIYVSIVLGYAATTFMTGGFAYFGIQYIQKEFNWGVDEAGLAFGGITAFTGIFGTGFGGYVLDRLRRRANINSDAKSAQIALKEITILTLLSLPFCVICFIYSSMAMFFICIGIGEFLVFATFSPTNSVLMWVVPVAYRPMACAMSTMGIHVLGDALSPVLIGKLVDSTGNWNMSMLVLSAWLVWGVIFYFRAFLLAKNRIGRGPTYSTFN